MKTTLIALLVLAVAACSSDSNTDGGTKADGSVSPFDAPIVVAGTATLTGGQTGTVMLNVTGVKGDADAKTSIGMASYGTLPTNVKTFLVAIQITGAPGVKEYAAADITGGITMSTNDNKNYVVGGGMGTLGKLTLTAADAIDHANNTTVYRLHGSFSGTLVNATSASDTVTVAITF